MAMTINLWQVCYDEKGKISLFFSNLQSGGGGGGSF